MSIVEAGRKKELLSLLFCIKIIASLQLQTSVGSFRILNVWKKISSGKLLQKPVLPFEILICSYLEVKDLDYLFIYLFCLLK